MNEKKKLRRLPKRILAFMLILAMVLTLMPSMSLTVLAADEVAYVERSWDDTNKKVVATPTTVADYTVVTDQTTWDAGWYVVKDSNVTINDRITLNGTVNLILEDGATLNAKKGIEGSSLNIYGQSAGTGKLNAYGTAESYDSVRPAIGMGNSDINIYGGTIYLENRVWDYHRPDSKAGDAISCKNFVMLGGKLTTKNLQGEFDGYQISCNNFTLNGGSIESEGENSDAFRCGIKANDLLTINGGKLITERLWCDNIVLNKGRVALKIDYESTVKGNITINGGDFSAESEYNCFGETNITLGDGIVLNVKYKEWDEDIDSFKDGSLDFTLKNDTVDEFNDVIKFGSFSAQSLKETAPDSIKNISGVNISANVAVQLM